MSRMRKDFATTRWSLILRAKEEDPSQSVDALESLCTSYWTPLYNYVRREGYGLQEAEDIVQSYFESLIRRRSWKTADASRGRFRSFLLGGLRKHLAEVYRKQTRQRRGGRASQLSDEAMLRAKSPTTSAEALADQEKEFDRHWAVAVVLRAKTELEVEFRTLDRPGLYSALDPYLLEFRAADSPSYTEVGEKLGMSGPAVAMAVKRMRSRFSEILRHVVADTVSDSKEVDEEIRYLFSLFAA